MIKLIKDLDADEFEARDKAQKELAALDDQVVVALKGRAGEGPAWFAEWSAMAEKVARLAAAAEANGHATTASAAATP